MNNCSNSRRSFLKTSALGAAGIMAGAGSLKMASGAWSPKMAINPDIDNLRVICCHDPNMIKADPTSWTVVNQNSAVDKNLIHANLDAMAMTLANKPTAAQAWATIFRKPAAKQWSEVRVALKVNTINTECMPRTAVIGKICMVLNSLGVPYGNMVIYDWNDKHYNSVNTVQYNSFVGNDIPAGVLVNNLNSVAGPYVDYLHGQTETPVPNYTAPVRCITDIANGSIDILVNFAVNKGHGLPGNATLAMKNHYGTFFPWDHGEVKSWSGGVTSINKSDAIIGGNPVRQQLCIIDSLWALSGGGAAGPPDCSPAKIIMGTFAPIMDWLTIMKIRIPEMGSFVWEPELASNPNNVFWMATDFGYAYSEFKAVDFIAPGGAVGASRLSNKHADGELKLVLSSKVFRSTQVSFPVPLTGMPVQVTIMDMKGRMIREFKTRGNLRNNLTVTWDGMSESRMPVPAGTYAIRIKANGIMKSGSITCMKG